MIEPFYLAAIPEPRTILGLKLRPLSLGHIILLNRVGSPFFTEGEPSFADLATAVLICSLPYKEGLDVLNDPGIDSFMSKWHNRITGSDSVLVRLGFKKPQLIDFPAKFKAFSDYISEHTKTPFYRYEPGDFRPMDCPYSQVIKITLMRDLNITEAELLDRSWLMCLWDFVTLKAMAGHVIMGGEEEIKEAQDVANRLAELFAKKNGHNATT